MDFKIIKKPNLFIVGFPRTGSTSVYNYLSGHPEVFVCPVKEPGDWKHLTTFTGNVDKYLKRFFEHKNEKIIVDATTGYILNDDAAKAISEFNADAKIIIIIREPIEYLLSFYWKAFSLTGVWKDFKSDILEQKEYTKINYEERVKRYYQYFGKNKVKVIIYDDYKRDNAAMFREITEFLEISTYLQVNYNIANRTNVFKNKVMQNIYEALLYSTICTTVRNGVKRLVSTSRYRIMIEKAKKIFYTSAPRIPFSQDFTQELRQKYFKDVVELGELLDRDLVSLWRYNKIK